MIWLFDDLVVSLGRSVTKKRTAMKYYATCNMQHAICNICTRGTLKPDHRLSSALMRNCLRRSSPKQATNWTPTQPFNYILKHANHCYISVFGIHTIGHCKGISSFYDLPTEYLHRFHQKENRGWSSRLKKPLSFIILTRTYGESQAVNLWFPAHSFSFFSGLSTLLINTSSLSRDYGSILILFFTFLCSFVSR